MSTAPVSRYYEITRELGSAQFTTVYLARDTLLNRTVTLKVLRLEGVARADVVCSRFVHEARLLASLNHPGLVELHEVGEWNGTMYWCCEFVDGGFLSQHLAS